VALGQIYYARYQLDDAADDFNRCIAMYKNAKALMIDKDERHKGIAIALSKAFLLYSECTASLDPLLSADKYAWEAWRLTTEYDPKPIAEVLDYIGRRVFWQQYVLTGEIYYLNTAISNVNNTLRLDELTYWDDYSTLLLQRFSKTHFAPDLECAIKLSERCVSSMEPDISKQALFRLHLGKGLMNRYELTGSILDINHAVDVAREAVQLLQPFNRFDVIKSRGEQAYRDFDHLAQYLLLLFLALNHRYRQTCSRKDVIEAMQLGDAVLSAASRFPTARVSIKTHFEILTQFLRIALGGSSERPTLLDPVARERLVRDSDSTTDPQTSSPVVRSELMPLAALISLEPVYPEEVIRKLNEHAEDIGNVLQSVDDVSCLSGFDQLSPGVRFLNDDDKDFFTGNCPCLSSGSFIDKGEGTRQIVWLEVKKASVEIIEDIVHRVADIVRPYPVAGLRLSDDMIVGVNDRYFVVTSSDADQRIQGSQDMVGPSGSRISTAVVGPTESSVERSTSTLAPLSLTGRDSVHPSGLLEIESSTSTLRSSESQGRSLTAMDPPSPPEALAVRETFPFIGILTIEDPAGLQQTVKIVFSIEITSSCMGDSIVTAIAVDNLRFLLPSACSPRQPSISSPYKQHFRCIDLTLFIGPDSCEAKICEPINQHPEMNWYVNKIVQAREINLGVTPVVAVAPALQASISMRFGSTVDYIALSQYIDFKNACIVEVRSTREHVWKYPLHKLRPNRLGLSISLPCHTSRTMYWKPASLTTLRTAVEATLEFNPDSRPKNKLRKNRSLHHPFNMGDAKHLLMRFSVVLKKKDGDQFIQFQGPGSPTELVHKINLCANLPLVDTSLMEGNRSTEDKQSSVWMQLR
jgi:hypothetical protein